MNLKKLPIIIALTGSLCIPMLVTPQISRSGPVREKIIEEFLKIPPVLVEELKERVKRSCTGYYLIRFPSGKELKFGEFSARRGCGRSVPNRCRRRARDSCHICMKAHWAKKEVWKDIPTECKEVPPSNLGVRDYKIKDLDAAIKKRACQVIVPNGRANVAIYRVTEGNRGCGPNMKKSMTRLLTDSYTVRCR